MKTVAWVTAITLVLDQLSKWLVVHVMSLDSRLAIDVLPPFLNFRMWIDLTTSSKNSSSSSTLTSGFHPGKGFLSFGMWSPRLMGSGTSEPKRGSPL